MWFLYLLVIIIALIINYIIAKKFEEIAEMKGHVGNTYFWFTFIFGLVGMLMVIALPNNNQENNHTGVKTKLPPPKDIFAKVRTNTTTDTVKRCPYCGDVVKLGKCEMCGKEVK
jgi:hypothetical protein